MGLFLVWYHRLICIVLSLCKHACKDFRDVKQGIDTYPLLARPCDRWWPDFVTFTACKRSIFGLKRGKKAQCVSNRCKDLFKQKKGVMGRNRRYQVQVGWIITRRFGSKCQLLWGRNRDVLYEVFGKARPRSEHSAATTQATFLRQRNEEISMKQRLGSCATQRTGLNRLE